MEQKQSIWSVIAIIVPLTSLFIFISPYLLFTYLKILNAENFFPFLLSESYLFPYLLFVSSFWFLAIIAIYILPSIVFNLVQKPINCLGDKNLKTQNYHIGEKNFLISSLIVPFLIYSILTLSSETSKFSVFLYLFPIFSFTILILICDIKLLFCKFKSSKILSCTFLLLTFIPFAIYSFNVDYVQFSAIPFFISVSFSLFIFTLLMFDKKIFTSEFNSDRLAMAFIMSIIIIFVSLGVILFINGSNFTGNNKNRDFFQFGVLLIFLYIIPNLIIFIISGESNWVKLCFIMSYLTLFFTLTNSLNFIAYNSFNTMRFINNEEINVIIDEWHSPYIPIPAKKEVIETKVFNAFQSLNYSILCKKSHTNFSFSKITFIPSTQDITNSKKEDTFHCIYVENKHIKLIDNK